MSRGPAANEDRHRRADPVGSGLGCLLALIGAYVGFGVWLHGARPGLGGGFEGEREWSLLYVELPLMALGVPALTLAAWGVTRAAVRDRGGRGFQTLLTMGVAVAALTVLGWACLAWWSARSAGTVPI
ncbi:hypothetical protein ACH4GK_34790 [Streptomyces rimosus]|uniref:hypothetical protein n=1 Tax=Streptomyces rimosus TaxID=1927 RepID=UPI00067DA8B3|nr:hypothetical protein [Streptomyces rimosus]